MEAAMNLSWYDVGIEQRYSDFTSWKTISAESEDSASFGSALSTTMESTGRKPDGVSMKANYRGDIVKFDLSLSSGMADLVENVTTRLNILKDGAFKVKYLDDAGDWVLIDCDADLKACMARDQNTIRMLIQENPSWKPEFMKTAMINGRMLIQQKKDLDGMYWRDMKIVDQTDILRIKEYLEDPDQSKDSLVDLLQSLADTEIITSGILRQTLIGWTVNKLRKKHSSRDVRIWAGRVFRKWKIIVEKSI